MAPGGESGIAQFAGPAALSDPSGRRPRLARGIADRDIAAKPDDVAEAPFLEKSEQLAVAKATIGEDRDRDPGRQNLRQPGEAGVLVIVAPLPQLLLPHRQPQQRRRPAMPGHQVQGRCRLPAAIEIGPVQGNDDLPPRSHPMRPPAGKAFPDIDLLVTEQAVDLLDRRLGHQTASLRQRLTDHRHRQRRSSSPRASPPLAHRRAWHAGRS
jgi:hypothetical protein